LLLARRATGLRAATLARAFLYAIVLFAIGICLQPFLGAAIGSWGAIALAAVVVECAVASDRPSRAHRALVAVCLSLFAIEAVLQLIAWIHPTPLLVQWGSDAGQYVERIRPARGATGAGGVPYNSWGDYDVEPARKPPGGCLVVMIGDSFSYGTVPLPLHFTKIAERALPGCTVYNAGIARIGPREYQYLLKKEALALEPDLIVVNLFLGNDIVDDYGCNPSPLRFWLDRENLLVYTVPKRLFFAGAKAEPLPMPNLDHMLETWPWHADPLKEPITRDAAEYWSVENQHARELCSPEAERYYRDFFVALDELVHARDKTPLAFLLIPDELQVEDFVWERVVRDNPTLTLDRDRPQRVVRAWLDERKLPYLDMLPVLRAAPPYLDGKKHFYVVQDTHYNARGNRATGDALAGFLKAQLGR
jgi:hypothetical protein